MDFGGVALKFGHLLSAGAARSARIPALAKELSVEAHGQLSDEQ